MTASTIYDATVIGGSARSGYRTLLLGDSITYRAGEGNGHIWNINGAAENAVNGYSGPFSVLNAACGHPFNMIRNGGVAGEKSDQIAARFNAEWNAAVSKAGGVDVVSIMAGTNDLGVAGYTAAITAANILGMAQQSLNRGAFVLLWGIPPKGSLTTAAVLQKQGANQALRNFANKNANCLFIDSEQETTDQTAVTGAWKSGYGDAGTAAHPATYAACYFMSRNAHTRIQQLFRPWPLIACAADSYDGYGSPASPPYGEGANVLTAAQSLGTGAGTATATSGAVIVGTPASGWTLQASGTGLTVTCSQVARSDGAGNDQVFSCAIASGTGHSCELFYQNGSKYSGSRWYELSSAAEIGSGEAYIEKLYGGIRAATGSLTYVRDLDYANITANSAQPLSPLTYRVVTPRIPYQGTDQMRVFFTWDFTDVAGTAVVKIGRVSVREYSAQV